MAPAIVRADDLAAIVEQLDKCRSASLRRPFFVALDGRSGVGKSTLAGRLAAATKATLLDGDSFFCGGTGLRSDSPEARARDCIDWRRQRAVLETLGQGRSASYHAFDWETFDGRLQSMVTIIEPAPDATILLEGVYSARPELADRVDVRMLMRVPDHVRITQLIAREQGISAWERQWHEAEEWYFANAAPPSSFDIIIEG